MIVVTGASRGIGRAIAERLSGAGIEVVGFARGFAATDFEIIPVDVSLESSIKDAAKSLRQRHAGIKALINAAGIASMNIALMAPPRTVQRVVQTNLLGTIFTCQALTPLMIRSGGGSIVNFSTIAVNLALQGESAYVASKAGVEAFSRTLAREVAGLNILVNCIAPGPIQTDLLRGISPTQVEEIINRQILQRRFTVSDVCDVVELLLDPRSGSLTGQVFHIGGV